MARTSPSQKAVIERVMHAFKEGDHTRNDGHAVENPKQAIAIALNEAGATNRKSPAENRRTLRRTKAREAQARRDATRAELYAEAKRRNIPGRSRMDRAALERALAG